jgi:hypothetical protein
MTWTARVSLARKPLLDASRMTKSVEPVRKAGLT